jgi:hypothetical protein
MIGVRAVALPEGAEWELAGARIARARSFADVPLGGLLWYGEH